MSLKFKITKKGYDVKTETEPRNFIFNSDYGSVVIFDEDEKSVVIPATSEVKSTVTYTQFSYIPIVMIFVELTPGSGNWHASPFGFNSNYHNNESCYVVEDDPDDTAVEDDKFYITFYNTTGSQVTLKYRYYILANLG